MPEIYHLEQIKAALEHIDPVQVIEQGFLAYSQGKAVIPPVGELLFEDPPGDMHIKYGFIKGDEAYVVKIASGFPKNLQWNLPTSDGIMLIFNRKTGMTECILLDKGHLTNVRTAAAGAVAARFLAPKEVIRIGVFGAGIQGRMQVEYLSTITECREVMVWGLNRAETEGYALYMERKGFHVEPGRNAEEIAARCNLIVTATPSRTPLLKADQIRPGTHITAMGADTPEKNELDPAILKMADILVVDSISQCLFRGECAKALEAGFIRKEDMLELGRLIADPRLGRHSEDQITVADLTGVAVQDIRIATAVFQKLRKD